MEVNKDTPRERLCPSRSLPNQASNAFPPISKAPNIMNPAMAKRKMWLETVVMVVKILKSPNTRQAFQPGAGRERWRTCGRRREQVKTDGRRPKDDVLLAETLFFSVFCFCFRVNPMVRTNGGVQLASAIIAREAVLANISLRRLPDLDIVPDRVAALLREVLFV